MSATETRPSPAFCTAPWVEVHLYHDGQTRLCDHNQESFGNWQRDGIEAVWRGAPYQDVRRKILAGEFPNDQCRSCHLNQNTSKLSNHVRRHFAPVAASLQKSLGSVEPAFEAMDQLLLKPHVQDWRESLAAFRASAARIRNSSALAEDRMIAELDQLELLATLTEDYLSGSLNPRYIGPSRQARLINKCNARCVMCAGNFNGDIINGPRMADEYVDQVLHPVDHLVSFASETSEFLLFSRWRDIAHALAAQGLPKLRVFTNGILMNRENATYLIDHRLLEALHFSMNGATRETIESGQVNVNFD